MVVWWLSSWAQSHFYWLPVRHFRFLNFIPKCSSIWLMIHFIFGFRKLSISHKHQICSTACTSFCCFFQAKWKTTMKNETQSKRKQQHKSIHTIHIHLNRKMKKKCEMRNTCNDGNHITTAVQRFNGDVVNRSKTNAIDTKTLLMHTKMKDDGRWEARGGEEMKKTADRLLLVLCKCFVITFNGKCVLEKSLQEIASW